MEFRRQRANTFGNLQASLLSTWLAGKMQPCCLRVLLAVLFLGLSPIASAQVALLVESRASIYQQAGQGFQQAFSGTDQVQILYLNGDNRTLEASFALLRQNPPRLVVAIGTQAARIARACFPNTPVLYCLALQPDRNNLVGANIGGIALDVDLSLQFEWIEQALPNLRRIGVVYNELNSGPIVQEARQYLEPQDIQLVERQVNTPQQAAREIEDLMSSVLSSQDAFWLLWDSVTANPANFRRLVELSLKYRVPLIAPARPFVEAGALISVGADYEQAGRDAAAMAERVLQSEARPSDFMAVPPSEAVITINGGVARRLGISIPANLPADVLAPVAGVRVP